MGERYAFGVDEPWKAWVAYAKAGWDTITRRGEPNQGRTDFSCQVRTVFFEVGEYFSLEDDEDPNYAYK